MKNAYNCNTSPVLGPQRPSCRRLRFIRRSPCRLAVRGSPIVIRHIRQSSRARAPSFSLVDCSAGLFVPPRRSPRAAHTLPAEHAASGKRSGLQSCVLNWLLSAVLPGYPIQIFFWYHRGS